MTYPKLGIIVLVLILGFGIFYFVAPKAFNFEGINNVSENNYKSEKDIKPLFFSNPFEKIIESGKEFRFADNQTENFNSTSLNKDAASTSNFSLNGIINNFQNADNSQTSSVARLNPGAENLKLPQVSDSELNISDSGAKTAAEYYKKFLGTVSKLEFSKEDTQKIKKENIGENKERPLLLEELIEKANAGDNLNELKDSFVAWHNFDEAVINELKKILIGPQMVSNQKMLIGWFRYHSQTAEKFSKGNLSKEQIAQLAGEFQKNAEFHNSNFGKSLSSLKKSSEFAFIPKAEAFTCGAFWGTFYHFGGYVTYAQICNFGIIDTISMPCGGMILFTWASLAANPYNWHNPYSGAAVLGRSLVEPGTCPLGPCPYCTYFPYEAILLYYGSSLIL